MLKKNSLLKKFNKLLLSVNAGIESFFNKIKFLTSSKKKIKDNLQNIDKKLIIIIGSITVLIISYFLLPTFYDKDLTKVKLTNQILEKYNLEVKFNGSLKYSFLPKPHFYINDTVVIYNKENLAKTEILKIEFKVNNFFSLDGLQIKNLNFKRNEFNINKKNYFFFEKILNFNKTDNFINFKNSKLFYKDQNEDVIFLTNIDDLKFLYNDELNQELHTNLEIFNIPLNIKIINNLNKKNYHFDLYSRKLRLNIENNLDYSEDKSIGLLNFKIINKLIKINYSLNKNSLDFKTAENNFNGKIDFKPFYFSSDINIYQLDISKILKNDSLFFNLINADILNNQSLNAVVNINFSKIKNMNYLQDIALKTYFEEGNIILKDSTLNWKNSVLINLQDVQLIKENNKMFLVGTIKLDFKNIEDFYKQYQIKKIYRKKIKKVKLDFLLDISENQIQFDNLKIDESSNKIANDYLNDFNLKKLNIFNKVIFKNSIKEFFSNI